MKLSIIVPVYNVEKYLERCINSLLNQELDDYEIIFVDDGSTDSSSTILKKYQKLWPNIIRVFQKTNSGQSEARNYGLERAKGEYLAFVDSDDFVSKNCYVDLLKIAEKGQYDIVIFDAFREYLSYQEPMEASDTIKTSRKISCEEYVLSIPGPWNKLIRKRLFIDHFLRFPSGIWYEDLAFIPQLGLYTNQIFYQKQKYYHYVQSVNSITRQQKYQEKWWDISQAVSILKEKLEKRFPTEMEYIYWNYFLYETSLIYYRYHRYDKINDIAALMQYNYPNWRKNKYIRRYTGVKKRLLAGLFYHKLYSLIAFGQSIKRFIKRKEKADAE